MTKLLILSIIYSSVILVSTIAKIILERLHQKYLKLIAEENEREQKFLAKRFSIEPGDTHKCLWYEGSFIEHHLVEDDINHYSSN